MQDDCSVPRPQGDLLIQEHAEVEIVEVQPTMMMMSSPPPPSDTDSVEDEEEEMVIEELPDLNVDVPAPPPAPHREGDLLPDGVGGGDRSDSETDSASEVAVTDVDSDSDNVSAIANEKEEKRYERGRNEDKDKDKKMTEDGGVEVKAEPCFSEEKAKVHLYRPSIMQGYSMHWNPRNRHVERPGDVKCEPDKISIHEVANDENLQRRLCGLVLPSMLEKADAMIELEKSNLEEIQKRFREFEEIFGETGSDGVDGGNADENKIREMFLMMRTRVTTEMETFEEIKNTLLAGHKYKDNVETILNKYKGKRAIRKKGPYEH